jgi:hypothetical protein
MDPDAPLAEVCQEAGEHKRPLRIRHFGFLHIAEHYEPSISTSCTTVVRTGHVFDDHVATIIRLQRFVHDHLRLRVPSHPILLYTGGVRDSLEKAGLRPRIE